MSVRDPDGYHRYHFREEEAEEGEEEFRFGDEGMEVRRRRMRGTERIYEGEEDGKSRGFWSRLSGGLRGWWDKLKRMLARKGGVWGGLMV